MYTRSMPINWKVTRSVNYVSIYMLAKRDLGSAAAWGLLSEPREAYMRSSVDVPFCEALATVT